MPDDDNIVLAHGFDEAFNGHDYFIPARYFLSNYNNLYNEVMPDGWSASDTGVRECPGYVMFGANQDKGSGWLMTPPLETRRYAFRNHRYVRSGFLCVGGL